MFGCACAFVSVCESLIGCACLRFGVCVAVHVCLCMLLCLAVCVSVCVCVCMLGCYREIMTNVLGLCFGLTTQYSQPSCDWIKALQDN